MRIFVIARVRSNVTRPTPTAVTAAAKQVMAVYDLIVVVGCALLYSLPSLWTFYNAQLYPRVLPWILPAVQGGTAFSIICAVLEELCRGGTFAAGSALLSVRLSFSVWLTWT